VGFWFSLRFSGSLHGPDQRSLLVKLGVFWCSKEVFRRVSWLPGGGGLTAPIPSLTTPLWTVGFRVVSSVVGACVLRLLVVFAPRTSSTPVATWFWQTEGRSAECVILGVRPSKFILLEFQSPSRRIFIGSHSLPPSLVA
jgi:hypothetical protein